MAFITDAKNALSLLIRGEWREFVFRLRVYRGEVDLENVSTDGLGLSAERSHEYSNSGGLQLQKVLNFLKISPQDAIVDFGSGKGGALITFSKYPFAKITGVEVSPELVAIAEKNFAKLKIRNIHMVVSDAVDFNDLEGYNYFYFFSPFPGAIMRTVVQNIVSSLVRKPRKATIIYLNPEFHHTVIADSPFRKIKQFTHHQLSCYIYSNVV
jgi:16S rRNA G966 N2-methylase RsmD